MAVEAKRGCGFRTVGGLYLVAGNEGRSCGKFPLPLDVCPACGHGIKPSRGWTWIDPEQLFGEVVCRNEWRNSVACRLCPANDFENIESAGLIWIGEQFYPTPEHFQHEANTLGISRKIASIPRGFELGKTWVFLAHRLAIANGEEQLPAVFRAFKPERVELICRESEREDKDKIAALERRGITPVFVPDDDPDHNPEAQK